ncbi:MAG TPA: hypothetical protein PLS04_18510, partial [Mycobacterium sp.]|nr:hypothetical protein [Mycobacterium sp.]
MSDGATAAMLLWTEAAIASAAIPAAAITRRRAVGIGFRPVVGEQQTTSLIVRWCPAQQRRNSARIRQVVTKAGQVPKDALPQRR